MIRIAAILLLAGCATVPAEPAAPVTGQWGGTHIGLSLEATGGQIVYDCASGTIGPIVPDSSGGFSAAGTHIPDHGGPAREGEIMPTYPAAFTGRVRSETMILEGRVANGVKLGPFTLRRGAEPGIFRCL